MEDTSQATDIAERESAIKSQEDKLKYEHIILFSKLNKI